MEKQRYFGGKTTLLFVQNAKNNIAILGEDTLHFEGETKVFEG